MGTSYRPAAADAVATGAPAPSGRLPAAAPGARGHKKRAGGIATNPKADTALRHPLRGPLDGELRRAGAGSEALGPRRRGAAGWKAGLRLPGHFRTEGQCAGWGWGVSRYERPAGPATFGWMPGSRPSGVRRPIGRNVRPGGAGASSFLRKVREQPLLWHRRPPLNHGKRSKLPATPGDDLVLWIDRCGDVFYPVSGPVD